MTETNYAVAPGEYLKEWIDERGFTRQRAADLLGYSREQVDDIVNGRTSITRDTAVRLARVTGISVGSWFRYEAVYRADLARLHRIDRTVVPPGALAQMAASDARPSPELQAAIGRACTRRKEQA